MRIQLKQNVLDSYLEQSWVQKVQDFSKLNLCSNLHCLGQCLHNFLGSLRIPH
jgi:hypothetical protein